MELGWRWVPILNGCHPKTCVCDCPAIFSKRTHCLGTKFNEIGTVLHRISPGNFLEVPRDALLTSNMNIFLKPVSANISAHSDGKYKEAKSPTTTALQQGSKKEAERKSIAPEYNKHQRRGRKTHSGYD